MESPWSILTLDPDTATVRDVKRAYAMLLKVHRPDADPIGFQRIHGAYQMALAMLGNHDQRETTRLELEPNPSASEPTPPAIAPPSPLAQLEANVREAATGKDSAALNSALKSLQLAVRNHPDRIPEWGAFLCSQFPDTNEPFQHLEAEDVFLLMEAGCHALPLRMLEWWWKINRTKHLKSLAERCLSRYPAFDEPAAVHIQARLVLLLAFIDAESAQKLANLTYPKLPPHSRSMIMNAIDERIGMGDLFSSIPYTTRRFWEERIFPPEPDQVSWPEQETRQHFLTAASEKTDEWPPLQIMQHIMPKPLFDTCRALAIKEKNKLTPLLQRPLSRKWAVWGGVIAFLLLKFGLLITKDGPKHTETQLLHAQEKLERTPPKVLEELRKAGDFTMTFEKESKKLEIPSASLNWLMANYEQAANIGIGSRFELFPEKRAHIDKLTQPGALQVLNEEHVVSLLAGKATAGLEDFQTGSESHLTLCTRLLHDLEKPLRVRHEAFAAVLQFYSKKISAEVLLYAARNPNDPIHDYLIAQAGELLNARSELTPAQISNLEIMDKKAGL